MSENWKSKHLQYIRGLPFLNAPRYAARNIEESFDYVARDGDIVLMSYPKTGTTLLGYIVLQIISNAERFPNLNDQVRKIVPFVDITGISAIDAQNKPRLYRQHFPFNMIKKNNNAKYLYIYRKPEDTLVSGFYFTQELVNDEFPLEDFFEDFLTGDIPYGSYFKHVPSYLSHKDDANLFITTYEKLMFNRGEEILRLAKFLGDEYHRCVAGDESVLNAIIEHTGFNYRKSRLHYDNPDIDVFQGEKCKTINFLRKGLVGDGRNVLSSDQMKRLRDVMEQHIEDKQLIDEWRM